VGERWLRGHAYLLWEGGGRMATLSNCEGWLRDHPSVVESGCAPTPL
jgi:hypothetical protein